MDRVLSALIVAVLANCNFSRSLGRPAQTAVGLTHIDNDCFLVLPKQIFLSKNGLPLKLMYVEYHSMNEFFLNVEF